MSKYTSFPRMTPFNRDSDFIFRKRTKINGHWYVDQDLVPKDLFTTRRLRQLYEHRVIQAIERVLTDEDEKTRPDFKSQPTAAIKDFLKTNGTVPRAGWLRATLIEKAEKLWDKKNGVATVESD